ncbi:MAG: alcohol dehydrogenase catalytic domain-containing protein [Anaerolineales bacterium]|nr:alcohol dehydrogenase catalytic domain-containing protein [Anaerolineales bacterium]
MRGLWLEDQQCKFREDLEPPFLASGEALLRMRLAGICSTDLELMRGYYPFRGIPGHEFVGDVVQAPDEPSWVGERVVGEINIMCGVCSACRAGRSSHCEQRAALGIRNWDGAFAEYLRLPLRNLHRVPDGVPDEAAVFAEPLAAALEIQQQVHIRPVDRVLVIGAGRLGQLIAQSLRLCGCELQVVARHPFQRDLLIQRSILTIEEKAVRNAVYDVVVEATGNPAGFALARKAVRPRGTIILKSTYKGDVEINLSSLVVDEVTVVGSRCGLFAPALRLLQEKRVDPCPLITATYSLEDGVEALTRAGKPGVLKVLLRG